MELVKLGKTGLSVSKICLGAMTYGSPKWRDWVLDEEASRPFIKAALEKGINFFDTADIYSLGASEEVLGRALKDFGPSRERAADQQRGRCQRRLDRHSGAEGKPKRGCARRQVLVTGMDQHQGAEFSRGGKEAVQPGVAEFGIPDPRADLDTQKAPAHAVAHLVYGQVRVLQGDGAQRGKAGWVLLDDPGEEVVLS